MVNLVLPETLALPDLLDHPEHRVSKVSVVSRDLRVRSGQQANPGRRVNGATQDRRVIPDRKGRQERLAVPGPVDRTALSDLLESVERRDLRETKVKSDRPATLGLRVRQDRRDHKVPPGCEDRRATPALQDRRAILDQRVRSVRKDPWARRERPEIRALRGLSARSVNLEIPDLKVLRANPDQTVLPVCRAWSETLDRPA